MVFGLFKLVSTNWTYKTEWNTTELTLVIDVTTCASLSEACVLRKCGVSSSERFVYAGLCSDKRTCWISRVVKSRWNTIEIRRIHRPKSWKILTKPFIWSVRNKIWKLWEVNVVKYENTQLAIDHNTQTVWVYTPWENAMDAPELSSWTIGR